MLERLNQYYAPSDAAEANRLFGATCGPCSLAALLKRDVASVRHYFPTLPDVQFTNLPMMARALRTAGVGWKRISEWPRQGLVLLCGPERYHSRHWIAVHDDFLYEVSLDTWLPEAVWRRDFLPALALEFDSSAEEWDLEAAFEVWMEPELDLS
jgi:hypothetical protein